MIHLALVIDEYGSVQGLVSSNDLLEALVGDLPSVGVQRPVAAQREDESWLMDRRLPIHEVYDLLQLENISGQEQGRFQTLAGFVIEHHASDSSSDGPLWMARSSL